MDIPSVDRLRLEVTGAVQGVGFRPYAFRVAESLRLGGLVRNTRRGAVVEIEGPSTALTDFIDHLRGAPPPIRVRRIRRKTMAPVGDRRFSIAGSARHGTGKSLPPVPADMALCAECRRELLDPSNRRYRYPFTACSLCGPRFSVIEDVPYDRERTTLKQFPLCPQCLDEYHDPRDRRFHAQATGCPTCGPWVEWWAADGRVLARRDAALRKAAQAVRDGKILALKGLGGFHLVADARRPDVVAELRRRKRREEKPFAVMVADANALKGGEPVSAEERRLLASREGPIVLLRRTPGTWIAPNVAPGNPCVGVLFPTTPLHAVLASDLGFPIVATSGNRTDEPICTKETEALQRLAGIADCFLVHNRPIVRPVEDSVARVVDGRPVLLRRARGYAPVPMEFRGAGPAVLALGGHLKNTIAFSFRNSVVAGPHGGDLDTPTAVDAFARGVEDLPRLHGARPEVLAADRHPDYASTRFGQSRPEPLRYVQHHHAHFAACLAEHRRDGPALGIVWDGSGWGPDGTVWGGEFLRGGRAAVTRFAHFRRFLLPGGEAAVRDPRRSALGLLFDIKGAEAFEEEPIRRWWTEKERGVLARALARTAACVGTSSVGRLFDGVSALLGISVRGSFEGQAAMALEFAAQDETAAYPFDLRGDPLEVNWRPLVETLLQDGRDGVPPERRAGRFHNALVDIAEAVAERAGERRVVLSGGCFQNVRLLTCAVRRLSSKGHQVLFHRNVPTNDGGLSLGQIAVVRAGGGWGESGLSRRCPSATGGKK